MDVGIRLSGDERRTMMLLDFLGYGIDSNLSSLNLMLILGDISGDMGFIGGIRAIKRKCNVLLSQPQNISEVPDVLTKWPWKSLATGEDLSENSQPAAQSEF